jgi:hypothetical protein
MKRLFFLSLLFSAVFFQPSRLVAQTFTSEEAKFQIDFACAYQQAETESEDSKTVKISCDTNGQLWFVGYTLHTVDMEDPMEMAQVSLDSFVESVGGTIDSSSEWVVGTNTGLQSIILFGENGENKIEYRAILFGNIQYQVLSAGVVDGFDSAAADTFFKSFKIRE